MTTFNRPRDRNNAFPPTLCLAGRSLALVLLLAAGCVSARHKTTVHVEHGSHIDSARVDQIVIGQTTRAELFEWFGPPHSMFKDEAELMNQERLGFYSYKKNRQLTTFEKGQYALLYRFDRTDAQSTIRIRAVFPFWKSKEDIDVAFTGDELLIFLDGDTHVVTDVASRNTASSS
jgi:hypothetical protein